MCHSTAYITTRRNALLHPASHSEGFLIGKQLPRRSPESPLIQPHLCTVAITEMINSREYLAWHLLHKFVVGCNIYSQLRAVQGHKHHNYMLSPVRAKAYPHRCLPGQLLDRLLIGEPAVCRVVVQHLIHITFHLHQRLKASVPCTGPFPAWSNT